MEVVSMIIGVRYYSIWRETALKAGTPKGQHSHFIPHKRLRLLYKMNNYVLYSHKCALNTCVV